MGVSNTEFFLLLFRATQETSKWVELSLQSIQTQIVPGSVIATPQQLQEFHQAIIRWVKICSAYKPIIDGL